ncbi:UNVERIFIED_ORG: tripartite ATP-independent transporter DctM subunit [Rhizobium sp. SORGH_AS 755]|nr:tripartite ATP-independent transporter DctM subunit [Rhizobium sp. SORGH_AS_0755]
MAYTILFGVFTLLMLIGTPIAFCLGIASFATVLYLGLPPIVVFQQMNSGMNVFAMMAIPFFIFAGDLMVRGGIAHRLIRFAAGLVGHLRGGLGQVNIVASTLFGGISGSAVADASAVGGLMIPQMAKRGYDRDYAVNVTVNAAIIALMIPPSHNMILYSIAAGGNVSVADLFTAGIIPGLLLAAALMVTAYIVARRKGYPSEPFPGFSKLMYYLLASFPGILLIGIIFGGVRSGIFTATESSCIAVLYAFLVAMLVYRELNWDGFVEAVMGAVRTTAMVLLVIGTAASFGWLMAFLQVQTLMIAAISAISDNPIIGAACHQHHPAAARHLHGHGADGHHFHAGASACRKGLRHRPRAFRRGDDPERRHRSQYAAGRNGALRRLRGWRHIDTGGDADDLAVLRRQHRRAACCHLYSVTIPVVAVTVPVIPALSNEEAPLCRGLFRFVGKQPLLLMLVKCHQVAVPAAAYPVHMVTRA